MRRRQPPQLYKGQALARGYYSITLVARPELYKFLMKESTRRIASETLPDLPDENADK